MTANILIITTSHAQLGTTGKQTGTWAEELMTPYYQFVDAGAGVTIASPKGGPAVFDPSSIKPAGENQPVVERFLTEPRAQARIKDTLLTASVDMKDFDAVFIPGGHGTMWDLPQDAGVTRLVEEAFASGKFIATVCHGAAALVSARRSDGQSIVAGKRINGFTNAEEEAAGLTSVVPFALESRLRELGCLFEAAPAWQPFAVCDGHFITGQNPRSSELVGRHLVDALGLHSKKQAA